MSLILLLLIILVVVGLPQWPYMADRNLGYYPSGVSLVLVIFLLIVLFR